MTFFKNVKYKNQWRHLSFWVGVWFFYAYFFSYQSTNWSYVVWFSTFLLPITIATTYFTTRILLPQFLLKKRYWSFALYSFYTLVLSIYLVLISIFLCLILRANFSVEELPLMSRNVFFTVILVYLVVGLMGFYSLLKYNFEQRALNKDLENKILTTQLQFKDQELKYLKKQIHPHFLFNTLNTIYGFSLRKSAQTPEMILKLSSLLDFILYQIQKPSVRLTEELKHIQDYIDLETMRFRDTLKVKFEMDNINEVIQIPPMLFIPFVENAFKHGEILDGFLKISIQIIVLEGNLKFSIQNTFKEKVKDTSNRIGLENIRKRLELLYPNQHDLVISQANNLFKVELSISKIQAYEKI